MKGCSNPRNMLIRHTIYNLVFREREKIYYMPLPLWWINYHRTKRDFKKNHSVWKPSKPFVFINLKSENSLPKNHFHMQYFSLLASWWGDHGDKPLEKKYWTLKKPFHCRNILSRMHLRSLCLWCFLVQTFWWLQIYLSICLSDHPWIWYPTGLDAWYRHRCWLWRREIHKVSNIVFKELLVDQGGKQLLHKS